jgi:transposase InsO family protein
LTDDIIELADQYGRYGYRMVTGLLNNAGWCVNHKRVERIWRREGLKVPQKQKKKGRLWLNDGSCVRLRPERPNHVWSYDFVQDRTADGCVYRTLNIIDEYTREALMIRVDRKLNSTDVLDALTTARQGIAQQCPERGTCSSCAARRNTSDPTMGRNLSPRRCGIGLLLSEPRPPT